MFELQSVVEFGGEFCYTQTKLGIGEIASVTANTMENLGDVATRVVMLTTQGLLETSMIILMILLCDWRIALVSLAGVAIFLVINTVMQNAETQCGK